MVVHDHILAQNNPFPQETQFSTLERAIKILKVILFNIWTALGHEIKTCFRHDQVLVANMGGFTSPTTGDYLIVQLIALACNIDSSSPLFVEYFY